MSAIRVRLAQIPGRRRPNAGHALHPGPPCPAQRGALDPHQRFGNAVACALLRLTTGRRNNDLGPMRVIEIDTITRLSVSRQKQSPACTCGAG